VEGALVIGWKTVAAARLAKGSVILCFLLLNAYYIKHEIQSCPQGSSESQLSFKDLTLGIAQRR
jgi:hypothetical protein